MNHTDGENTIELSIRERHTLSRGQMESGAPGIDQRCIETPSLLHHGGRKIDSLVLDASSLTEDLGRRPTVAESYFQHMLAASHLEQAEDAGDAVAIVGI